MYGMVWYSYLSICYGGVSVNSKNHIICIILILFLVCDVFELMELNLGYMDCFECGIFYSFVQFIFDGLIGKELKWMEVNSLRGHESSSRIFLSFQKYFWTFAQIITY